MVRKISALVCTLVLICALCTTAQASTHEVYENGTISSTYITYFKDILSGLPVNQRYIAFRSGQNEYTMIVAENCGYSADSSGTYFTASGYMTEYKYYSDSSNYNQTYKFNWSYPESFELKYDNDILYTNFVEGFPTLANERSDSIEFLQTVCIAVIFFTTVISRFFISGSRRKR